MSKLNIKYNNLSGQIINKINKLNICLETHKNAQKKDSTNWGYVGDLEHINYQLKEMLDLFKKS